MFAQSINEHILLSEDAEQVFKVNQFGNAPDRSALATLRVLATNRMGENDSLAFSYQSLNSRFREDFADEKRIVSTVTGYAALPSQSDPPRITVINVSRMSPSPEFTEKIFHALTEHGKEVLESDDNVFGTFEPLERITVFYRKAFPVLCFVDLEHKHSILFTSFDGLRAFHYLQCCFPAVMPWLYTAENPANDDEKRLASSLREKLADSYLGELDKFAAKYNFDELRIKRLLNGFETRRVRNEIESSKSNIANYERRIEQAVTQMMGYIQSKEEAEVMLIGLMEKLKRQESEPSAIETYFVRNKSLDLEACNDSTITFSVYTNCMYFVPDEAKRVIDNFDSAIYEGCEMDREDFKKLLTAIFIDGSLTLRFHARYKIDTRGGVEGIENGGPNRNGYISNPHIRGFGCLGENSREVLNLLQTHRYVAAIEQCIASAGGFTFTDYTVVEEFGGKLSGSGRSCIELPGGKVVTPKKAVEYLKEQEGE